MKKLLSLGVVFVLIVMTATTLASSQSRSAEQRERDAGIRGRFVGAWRLARLEEEGVDGKIHRADCTGMLVYTSDGHMSVPVMYRNQQANPQTATSAAPVQYAERGYEASFGTYEIEERPHTLSFEG
jgi:Lipocalin-like domain